MSSRTRIMIINWKWEDPAVPKFSSKLPPDIPTDKAGEAKFLQESFDRDWKAYHKTLTAFFPKKADKVEGDAQALVFRVNIDLQALYLPKVREKALEIILQFFKKSWAKTGEHQILAFFHEKHGFQRGLVAPPQAMDGVKYYTFGGGYGPLYSRQGLLDHSGEYQVSSEMEAAKWDDNGKVIHVKQKPFDYIWDHYWYGTIRRIKEIRKLYHAAMIPGMDLEKQVELVFRHLADILQGKKSELNPDLVECDLNKVPEFQDPAYRKLNFHLDEEALIRDISAVLENIKQGKGLYSDALSKTLDQAVTNLNT